MKPINRTRPALSHAVMAAAGLALISTPSNAELILLEQFDYEAGPLNGNDGGLGFEGGWVNTGWNRDYEIGLLTYSNGPGSTINALGGLEFPGLDTAGSGIGRFGTAGQRVVARTPLASSLTALTADSSTIWFSVLVSAPTANSYGTMVFGTDPLMAQQTAPPFPNGNMNAAAGQGFGITLRSSANGSGTGSPNAIAFIDSDAPTVVEGTFQPSIQEEGLHYDTALIVGKINWNANGTADELFLFNIEDAGGAEPAEEDAIATITADFDQANFDTLSFWDTGSTIYDEVRFGTNFADIVGSSTSGPLSLNIATSGENFSFTWNSAEGQAYDLVSSTDLSTSPAEWPVYGENTNIIGSAPENSLIIPAPAEAKRFFAIIARDPLP
ncbi:hypothetical protein V2O64_15825 [Verrucomicrobiaceae bacterium 227]